MTGATHERQTSILYEKYYGSFARHLKFLWEARKDSSEFEMTPSTHPRPFNFSAPEGVEATTSNLAGDGM